MSGEFLTSAIQRGGRRKGVLKPGESMEGKVVLGHVLDMSIEEMPAPWLETPLRRKRLGHGAQNRLAVLGLVPDRGLLMSSKTWHSLVAPSWIWRISRHDTDSIRLTYSTPFLATLLWRQVIQRRAEGADLDDFVSRLERSRELERGRLQASDRVDLARWESELAASGALTSI